MQKVAVLLVAIFLSRIPVHTSCKDIGQHQEYTIGDVTTATFLFLSGSWLAHKQLPRLAGTQIEYNAPFFTKIVATILFLVGLTGGIVGATQLSLFIHKLFQCQCRLCTSTLYCLQD